MFKIYYSVSINNFGLLLFTAILDDSFCIGPDLLIFYFLLIKIDFGKIIKLLLVISILDVYKCKLECIEIPRLWNFERNSPYVVEI